FTFSILSVWVDRPCVAPGRSATPPSASTNLEFQRVMLCLRSGLLRRCKRRRRGVPVKPGSCEPDGPHDRANSGVRVVAVPGDPERAVDLVGNRRSRAVFAPAPAPAPAHVP